MSVSPSFRSFAIEQLARVTPNVRDRSMFGGVGIYSDELFFALISDDTLYLKVDDSNRRAFVDIGMSPFQPFGPDGEAMQYYTLPADLLEDVAALKPWVDAAVAVAASARKKRPAQKKKAVVRKKKPT